MVVYNQFKDEQGVIDHGGVLNDSVKDLLPQHELTRYFRKIAEQGLEDTFLSLKKFVETERVAYKLADISSSSTGQRSFVTRSEEVQPQPSAIEEYETEQDYYQTNAAFIPNPNYKPKYSPNSTYAKPKPDGETKPTIHGPNSSSSPLNLVKKVCSCCDKDHLLYQCPQFRMLTVTEKFKHIFASKSCIHCLNVGHLLKDCTFYPDRACGIEGCTDKHHRQLHNYPDSKGRTLLTVEEFIHQQVLMSFQTCHTQNEDEYIAIRTTTAIVSHGGKQKRVVIAMDPCSNSTNIDSDFAKEMGLTVEEEGIVRNINFLESSAQVHSDLVSFMLSPLDKSATFKVKAYTVKNLITGTPVVDWKQVAETYPHLKKAQIPDTQDTDRVHILLGTDYAHLNGVIEGVFGKDFEPIAELTRLGWAFSGRVKTKQILPSWISQFGNVANSVFFSYMGRNVAPWVQSKPRLAQNFAIYGKADPILDKKKQATIHGFTVETITEECETHSSTSDIPTVCESEKLVGTLTSTEADLACVAACNNNPGLLKCRPIQVVSDLRDYEVLTPNHFLLPDLAGTVFPPEVKEEDRLKLSTRLKHQIMIQQHVWRRFQEEVVPMLGPRKKWCRETPNLHENDVVMEMDDNQPRGAWRLLRVTKIIPGSDGLIRKVEVINSTGKTYLRPIHKLIPIARE
jgi:hypothetical protein